MERKRWVDHTFREEEKHMHFLNIRMEHSGFSSAYVKGIWDPIHPLWNHVS